MRILLVLVSILGLSWTINPAAAQGKPADQPVTSLSYTPGLDVSSMDKTFDPCEDFCQYSCGGWMKSNPIGI